MAQMTQTESDGFHPVFGENRDADSYDELPDRAVRARTEFMAVVPQTDADDECTGMYDVYSQSGSTYTVDAVEGVCDCPDMVHNLDADAGERCKHLRRVALLIQHTDLPQTGGDASDYFDTLDDLGTDVRDELESLTRLLDVLTAAEFV